MKNLLNSLVLLPLAMLSCGLIASCDQGNADPSVAKPAPQPENQVRQAPQANQPESTGESSTGDTPKPDGENGESTSVPEPEKKTDALEAPGNAAPQARWTPLLQDLNAMITKRGHATEAPELGVWRDGVFHADGEGLPSLKVGFTKQGMDFVKSVQDDKPVTQSIGDLVQRATLVFIDAGESGDTTYAELYAANTKLGTNHSVKTHVEFTSMSEPTANINAMPIDIWQTKTGSLVLAKQNWSYLGVTSGTDKPDPSSKREVSLVVSASEADLNPDGTPAQGQRGTEFAAAVIRGFLIELSGKE